jgi:energy-coupling factor transport system permease protein
VTWLLWAVAAAATVELAPSPLYVALVIAVAALVVQVHGLRTPLARAFPALVLMGVGFALVRIVLTAATTHGGDHVLFTTPSVQLPRLLGGFVVGGTVELPVVLQAAAESFVLVGVMAAFGAFNAVVSHYELVRSAPRAFYEPGLVVTVALAFVPSAIDAVGAVREADRARTGGRVVRRGRLLRLVVPILESGMERAMTLAESMDSRGFAHTTATAVERAVGWCVLGSLLALAAAFTALVGRAEEVALACGFVGAGALVGALAVASRRATRTRYRPAPPTGPDWAVSAIALMAPVGVAALALLGDRSLTWAAADLRWPAFDPWAGLAVAALAVPALVTDTRTGSR